MNKKLIFLCGISLLLIQTVSSASLILYPNSDTFAQLLRSSGANNYALVDELVFDDSSTYVYRSAGAWGSDWYTLTDPPTTGNASTITKVTIFSRITNWVLFASSTTCFRVGFYSKSTTNYSAEQCRSSHNNWGYHSYARETNPAGGNWTWEDIANLEAVNSIRLTAGVGEGRITETYVLVEYDVPAGEIIRPEADVQTDLLVIGKADNFEAINESVYNGSDYVASWQQPHWRNDTYDITDSDVGSGTINSITAVANQNGYILGSNGWGLSTVFLNISGNEEFGWEQRLRVAHGNYSQTWDTNPNGTNWTWNDVDILKAGLRQQTAGSTNWGVTTYQYYFIVNYTGAALPACECPGSGDWVVDESCILEENCDITVNAFALVTGDFYLQNDSTLTCTNFSVTSGGKFVKGDGSKIVIHV